MARTGFARGVARGLSALVLSAVGLVALAPSALSVPTITYTVEDTPEAGPLDVWRYRYVVSGVELSALEGFSVLFDETRYRSIFEPAGSDEWDVIVLQPDPLLPDPGRFDAQAKVGSPSLPAEFLVAFIWLGPGAPGSQPFEIYDADFQTVFSGTTTLVPEPGTALLLALGLLGTGLRRRYA